MENANELPSPGLRLAGLSAQWPVLLFLCAQISWAEHSYKLRHAEDTDDDAL
ncbi:MAG: hypothetical protein LUF30_12100 [Lachnospiraceae bacterium]|nr:hypothetical protein [Lachnospiraceae bacterium]